MREKGQTEVAKTLETPVFSRGIEILTEKSKFRAVVLRRKGAVAYGVQQEVQTKRGLFPFPLRQGGKKFVLPWRRKRHTRLGEIIG